MRRFFLAACIFGQARQRVCMCVCFAFCCLIFAGLYRGFGGAFMLVRNDGTAPTERPEGGHTHTSHEIRIVCVWRTCAFVHHVIVGVRPVLINIVCRIIRTVALVHCTTDQTGPLPASSSPLHEQHHHKHPLALFGCSYFVHAWVAFLSQPGYCCCLFGSSLCDAGRAWQRGQFCNGNRWVEDIFCLPVNPYQIPGTKLTHRIAHEFSTETPGLLAAAAAHAAIHAKPESIVPFTRVRSSTRALGCSVHAAP